jgi:CheY-like chemotaxis protein
MAIGSRIERCRRVHPVGRGIRSNIGDRAKSSAALCCEHTLLSSTCTCRELREHQSSKVLCRVRICTDGREAFVHSRPMPVRCATFSTTVAPPAPLLVLLAEDNAVLRKAATELLSRWHIELHIACDGRQALRKAQHREFDVILMDLNMPVMNGYEATRGIRLLEAAQAGRERAAIIAYTSSDWEPLVARIAEAGFDTVLVKPTAPDLMCRILFQWAANKVHRVPDHGCDGHSDVRSAQWLPVERRSVSSGPL